MRIKVQKEIQTLCSEYCGCQIELKDELIESGLMASLMLFDLMCELEELFSIEFCKEEIKDINNFSTVNSMTELILKKVGDKK